MLENHWVYAIGAMSEPTIVHAIKIGVTSAFYRSRLSALQTGCPMPLAVLGVKHFRQRGNANQFEKLIHAAFRPDRVHGEWFKPSSALERMIRRSFNDAFALNHIIQVCLDSHHEGCECEAPEWSVG